MHRAGPAEELTIFSVPFSRNPNFTGRESVLKAVREALDGGEAAALTQAIVGLGGVGKTQLALEYAYRHREEYAVVWWVRSDDGAQLAGDYGRLAVELGLVAGYLPDQREIVAATRRWLEHSSQWLLIFDNAPNRDVVYEYLPRGGKGHVLITSRDQAWGGVAKPVRVPEFPRPESVEFLKKRAKHEEGADQLAHALGDLPLALELAAAYVEETGCTLPGYLKLVRTRDAVLLEKQRPPVGYSETVGTTWAVAMDRVKAECSPAADLLNLCAFLAPDDIPLDVIREHADLLPDRLAEAVRDDVKLNETRAALLRYSLAEVEGEALSVHRLVQAVTRDRLSQECQREWAARAVRLLHQAFPFKEDAPNTWEGSGRLLPHALAAAEQAIKAEVEFDKAGDLFNNVGMYLNVRAQYAESKATSERALAITEGVYGHDDPRVGLCNITLGEALFHMRDLQGAKERFGRALVIFEQAYSQEHPLIAVAANDLGLVLQNMDDLEGARELFERALAIDEKVYGAKHARVAVRVSNLGLVLHRMRDLEGARQCFERALAIAEEAYGPDHPGVATSVVNLGSVLAEVGQKEDARRCYERALAIFRKFLGDDHPSTKLVRRKLQALDG